MFVIESAGNLSGQPSLLFKGLNLMIRWKCNEFISWGDKSWAVCCL